MAEVEVINMDEIRAAFTAALKDVKDWNNSFDWPEAHTFVYREIDGVKIEVDVQVRETPISSDSFVQSAKRPIALFIHGGGWMAGIRNDCPKPIVHEFITKGFAFVSIDYRLLPEVDFITGQLNDVAFVETWIREKLQSCLQDRGVNVTVDTDAIVVLGGSAGSHLASLTPKIWKKKPQALLLLAGPTNLFLVRKLGRPLGGGKLTEVVARVPLDPTPEFIKSAFFESVRTNSAPNYNVEPFSEPRSLLSLSIHLNDVIPEFLVLGLPDGKLPKKGSAPKEKIEFISAYFGDLSDWPPTFQMVGDTDEAFDVTQLSLFHDKLRDHNIPSAMLVVPQKSHGYEGMAKIGDPTHLRYIQPACEFVINSVLKENKAK
ncbi:uncharacterized protein Z520_09024 [Fonsecaea multimorphosa CBS 102226]|uniref:BD-FAE-like domain-containing protein n=1 Tax=Fonsecaea multimorphosa CBS 102226 TaxID=1442371 RepID=A0A0D2KEG3_9EURO|nr:uncharacterized protein Z520_09024 [Fonsecaea multimorphosa CBS 102226]KIX95108.1 hypothetical protein Z520_09024 [Fonsecaea multimorphosa CBS 102226]OAL20829.1 hypothetical protein AYO22_08457 [Fonsecaea multimorphosa]